MMSRRRSWLARFALLGQLVGVLMLGLAIAMVPPALLAYFDGTPDLSGTPQSDHDCCLLGCVVCGGDAAALSRSRCGTPRRIFDCRRWLDRRRHCRRSYPIIFLRIQHQLTCVLLRTGRAQWAVIFAPLPMRCLSRPPVSRPQGRVLLPTACGWSQD